MRGRNEWLPLVIPGMIAMLLAACENRDPLAPLFAVSKTATVAAPSNLTLTVDSYHQIWLAWQDNATNESGYEVWKSTTGPTGTFSFFTTYPWPNSTAGGNDLLEPATQYCYKVRAYNTQGQSGKTRAYSDFSNTACATTLSRIPAAPSDAHAAPRFNWPAIHVTWIDNSSNETGFRVERAAIDTGPWTSLGITSANVTTFDDGKAPAAEQPACYRVLAVNSYGDSAASNVTCTALPQGPANLAATVASDGSVDLSWTDISAIEDGFAVYRWTPSGSFNRVATLPTNATSYHEPWSADSTYYYRVYATKDSGSSAGSNTVSVNVITMPPTAPLDLNAMSQSSTSIAVTWSYGSANAESFRVEGSTDGGMSWVTAGTGGSPFIATDLPSEQQVCYRAFAYNVKGESPPSNADCTAPPIAPTGLSATGVDATTIDFAWNDNSAVEGGYEIDRVYSSCDADGCYTDYISLGSVAPNATSYRASGLNTDDYYYSYIVVAIKDGGRSDVSNTAAPATISNLTASAAVAGQIDLVWTNKIRNDGAFIERCQGDAAACSEGSFGGLGWALVANATTFSDKSVQGGTTYSYRVRSYNAMWGWFSAPSNVATATAP